MCRRVSLPVKRERGWRPAARANDFGLVSSDLKADLAEGACFNDTQVEVSRV